MELAGEAEAVGLGAAVGDDGLDGDEFGVDEGGEDGGDGALDVADLDGAGVEDLDGVWIVGVEGLAEQAHHLAAADGAGVVPEAHDVGGYEAQ